MLLDLVFGVDAAADAAERVGVSGVCMSRVGLMLLVLAIDAEASRADSEIVAGGL